jgi:acetylornithine deacetylase
MKTDPAAVIELLKQLVACPSMNPGDLSAFGAGYGERSMADLLNEWLRPLGGERRIIELAPGRCNFLATWTGKDPSRSLLLDAHADTVGVDGMTIPPFEPGIRDGRLYGRGACDTKGGMAAMLLAIRRVLAEDGQPPVTLHFAATGDEEDGALGASRLVESGLRVDAAIVAEPTELKIVYAHKGACRFRIHLAGKAAHSSVPWLGVNAVEAAAEVACAFRRGFIERLLYQHHPELGNPTACITTIAGGIRVNIIPDRCRMEADCRCLPGEKRAHLEAALRALLEGVARSFPGLVCECEVFQWYPALAGSAKDSFVSQMAESCRDAIGRRELGTVPYGTNGGYFSEAGIPCIIFGPGSIAQAHTADEFVEVAQVEQAVDAYVAMIRGA